MPADFEGGGVTRSIRCSRRLLRSVGSETPVGAATPNSPMHDSSRATVSDANRPFGRAVPGDAGAHGFTVVVVAPGTDVTTVVDVGGRVVVVVLAVVAVVVVVAGAVVVVDVVLTVGTVARVVAGAIEVTGLVDGGAAVELDAGGGVVEDTAGDAATTVVAGRVVAVLAVCPDNVVVVGVVVMAVVMVVVVDVVVDVDVDVGGRDGPFISSFAAGPSAPQLVAHERTSTTC